MEETSCTLSELHNSPEHSHDDPLLLPQTDENSLQIYESSKHKVCLNFWEPSLTTDLLLCSPAAELHYLGQTICHYLFVCDANDNPIRNITVAQVRCSALYCALLRYLTAKYLNRIIATDDAQHILQTAKTDALFQLQKGRFEATTCKTSEEVLLATMMFGLSGSWNGANHTGVECYRQALSIFHQAMESKPRQKWVFYEHALMYWWSGLAFVIDSTTDVLPGPPVSGSFSSRSTAISAHPLAGISPQSHWLMGQVGTLIYSRRTCMLERSFLSRADIRAQERMICQSQQLEQALLSLRVPTLKDVRGMDDVGTPAADLRNVAEAYQLCALLLLYRCFPDLLHGKLALEAELEQTTADQYMARCALEALNVIERNGVIPRTRSVEQLLLLIIAGGLRLPNQEGSLSTSVSEQEGLLSEPYPPSEPLGSIHDSPDTGTAHFSSTAFSSDLSTTPLDKAFAEAQQILAARALVCTRMSAVRSILPYRSVEQVEELMWDVWWKSDNGKQTFWMDIMICIGQRFVTRSRLQQGIKKDQTAQFSLPAIIHSSRPKLGLSTDWFRKILKS